MKYQAKISTTDRVCIDTTYEFDTYEALLDALQEIVYTLDREYIYTIVRIQNGQEEELQEINGSQVELVRSTSKITKRNLVEVLAH